MPPNATQGWANMSALPTHINFVLVSSIERACDLHLNANIFGWLVNSMLVNSMGYMCTCEDTTHDFM